MDWVVQYFDVMFKTALAAFAGMGLYYAIKNQISSLRADINHIKENQRSLSEAFTQLGNILTKVAVQDMRLQMIEKKLDELSHGQGFVRGAA